MCEVIRPGVIYKWVKFLENSELYQKLKIKINEEWSTFDDSYMIPFICDKSDESLINEIIESECNIKFK